MSLDSQLQTSLDRLGRPRVLVVGDIMLDRYAWCDIDRISPEAPIPVLEVTSEASFAGGASNVAVKCVEFGGESAISGVVGNDSEGLQLFDTLRKSGVDTGCVLTDNSRPTTLKTRYLAKSQQVVRVDRELRKPIDAELQDSLFNRLNKRLERSDVLVISDYNKGLLTVEMLGKLIANAHKRDIPVVVDPKGCDYSRYRGADILTPNVKEAMAAAGVTGIESDELLRECALKIFAITGAKHLVITRSARGMTVYSSHRIEKTYPARRREVYDVTGAGDAVAAMFAIGLGSGLNPFETAPLAVVVAGLTVAQLGVGHVSRNDLKVALLGGIVNTSEKIATGAKLDEKLQSLRSAGKKIVFTNGCFDLLHAGHIKLLEQARELGDALVVALNTDASVSRLKGASRPIINEASRAAVIASLFQVDIVTMFADDTPLELIRQVRPDVLVKGGDYTIETVVGADIVQADGGIVMTIPLVAGFSTTDIVRRVLEAHGSDNNHE